MPTMAFLAFTRRETLRLLNPRPSIKALQTSPTYLLQRLRAKERTIRCRRHQETQVKMCYRRQEIKLVAIAIPFGTERLIVPTILNLGQDRKGGCLLGEAKEEAQESKERLLVEHQSLMACRN